MVTGDLANILLQGPAGLTALSTHAALGDLEEVGVFDTALGAVSARLEQEGVDGDTLYFLRKEAERLRQLLGREDSPDRVAGIGKQVRSIVGFLSRIPPEKFAQAVTTAKAHVSLFADAATNRARVTDALRGEEPVAVGAVGETQTSETMKVLYYRRYVGSDFHIHANAIGTIFYIPDLDVILYAEQVGSFDNIQYGSTNEQEMLDEARKVSEGSGITRSRDY